MVHYFISIHHCFHSKENGHCTILHYICCDTFFGAFTNPILLHIVTHQGIFFVIVIVFLIALLLVNGHKVQQQLYVYILFCIFIFILFVADFCNKWKLFDRKKRKEKKPTNCLSVFDRFVWLALKGLKKHQKTSGFLIFPGDIERDQ